MKPLGTLLTDEEIKRNSHGPCLVYSFDKTHEPFVYSSVWPTQFPDVINCKVR